MFVGRKEELDAIGALLKRPRGSALVIGKRKVGKTRLLLEALRQSGDPCVYYECVKAPVKENVEGLANALAAAGVMPVKLGFESFFDVFKYLNTLDGTFNVVIDEYPYLKRFADGETVDSWFQRIIDGASGNVRLFLSGSHIGMMKDLLEEKNALYGRFDLVIRLKELNYREASQFVDLSAVSFGSAAKSAYEKIGFYAVFGGSPFVCEQLDPSIDLRGNIEKLLLNPLSSVYSYAENLLISDLSGSINSERIFHAIGNGRRRYSDLETLLGMKNNGLLSKQLKTLLDMDLVAKVYPINRPEDNKRMSYELTDNLLRFWYTYIYKRRGALQVLGPSAFFDAHIAPSLVTFISHRMEEIVRSYFSLSVKSGKRRNILNIGTYYYDDSVRKLHGEFDVALEHPDGFSIYEVKYLSSPLKLTDMLSELEQVKAIRGLAVSSVGFVSANGFEGSLDGVESIDGDALY